MSTTGIIFFFPFLGCLSHSDLFSKKGILICVLPYLPKSCQSDIFIFYLQSGEESCWLYEDDQGRKHGPNSLSELHAWHSYGYLQDVLMVNYEITVL